MGAGTASDGINRQPVCAIITAHGRTRRLEDCSCVGGDVEPDQQKEDMSVLTSPQTWKHRHILGVALTQADVARMKCGDSQAARRPTVPERMSDPSLWKVGIDV